VYILSEESMEDMEAERPVETDEEKAKRLNIDFGKIGCPSGF
jgi:hypothetical protein